MEERFRLNGLDTLRGLTLVSMIIYHACWDLVWIFGVDWAWYRSQGAYIWQQSICWTFILLSGYCFHLGRHHLRHGGTVFICGGLVTLVTVVFMPENRIFFGVLSLLGSAALLTVPMDKVFRRIPGNTGAVCTFLCFALTRHISGGFAGLRGVFTVPLPAVLYRNDLTACVGFPPPDFRSTDYFPLIPWIFLFWTGYFLFSARGISAPSTQNDDSGEFALKVLQWNVAPLAWMGRHSLLIYLLHQPVVYAVLTLWNEFFH